MSRIILSKQKLRIINCCHFTNTFLNTYFLSSGTLQNTTWTHATLHCFRILVGLVPSQNYTHLSKYSILQCLYQQLNLSLMQTQSQMIYLKRINNEHGKLGAVVSFGLCTIKFCMKNSLVFMETKALKYYPVTQCHKRRSRHKI